MSVTEVLKLDGKRAAQEGDCGGARKTEEQSGWRNAT